MTGAAGGGWREHYARRPIPVTEWIVAGLGACLVAGTIGYLVSSLRPAAPRRPRCGWSRSPCSRCLTAGWSSSGDQRGCPGRREVLVEGELAAPDGPSETSEATVDTCRGLRAGRRPDLRPGSAPPRDAPARQGYVRPRSALAAGCSDSRAEHNCKENRLLRWSDGAVAADEVLHDHPQNRARDHSDAIPRQQCCTTSAPERPELFGADSGAGAGGWSRSRAAGRNHPLVILQQQQQATTRRCFRTLRRARWEGSPSSTTAT